MRVGIVGSRRRSSLRDRSIVFDIVRRAKEKFPDTTVVSGAASGPDTFAKDAATFFKVGYTEHPVPRDPPFQGKWEFRQRAFARNRDIVIDSDVVFALVHPDRTGGTENTIEHAIDLKKRFFLVDEEGRCYLSGDGWEERDDETTDTA